MKFSTSAVTVALATTFLATKQSSYAFIPASLVGNPSSSSSSKQHHPFGILKPLMSTTVDVDATTDDATAEKYE